MRWRAVPCAAAEEDAAANRRPGKKRSSERIDGIAAPVMGLDRAARRREEGSVCDAETMGLLVIG